MAKLLEQNTIHRMCVGRLNLSCDLEVFAAPRQNNEMITVVSVRSRLLALVLFVVATRRHAGYDALLIARSVGRLAVSFIYALYFCSQKVPDTNSPPSKLEYIN